MAQRYNSMRRSLAIEDESSSGLTQPTALGPSMPSTPFQDSDAEEEEEVPSPAPHASTSGSITRAREVSAIASISRSPIGKDDPTSGSPTNLNNTIPQNEILIAVMGATGVGKSTFISWCCDDTKKPQIGDDLESCTQEVAMFTCRYRPGTKIFLIDTPGFDDTKKSEIDVLRELAGWFTSSYSADKKLNGIIYFHRITDRRMAGSAMRNLDMFKKLVGAQALDHVILATSMWEEVKEEVGRQRTEQLESKSEFWGAMVKLGSVVKRHYNTRESAMDLLEHFAGSDKGYSKVVLDIQSQMVDYGVELPDTAAGMVVEAAIAKSRREFQAELAKLRDEAKAALEQKDNEASRRIQEETAKADARVRALNEESEKLRQKFEESILKQQEMEVFMRNAQEAMSVLWQTEKGDLPRVREADVRPTAPSIINSTSEQSDRPTDSEGQLSLAGTGMSITLLGKRYYLRGARTDKWDMGHPSLTLPILRTMDSHEINHYVDFGAGRSWFQHYHNKKSRCRTRLSMSVAEYYPKLWAAYNKSDPCPECVSLGVNSYFFILFENGRTIFNLPTHVEEVLGDVRSLKSLWLGYGGAWYGVTRGGEVKSDFQGHYLDLHQILSSVPKDWEVHRLCFDISCADQWIVVWKNGKYASKLCPHHSVMHLRDILPKWFAENGITPV